MAVPAASGSSFPSRLAKLDPPLSALLLVTMLQGLICLLRLQGTGWDQYVGLHPDERHMIFTMSDMLRRLAEQPAAADDLGRLWFGTGVSPLDPRRDGGSYVYGEFPLLAVTLLAKWQATEGWESLLHIGRATTSIVESTAALAVFMTSYTLRPRLAPALLAMAVYAAAPTAMQLTNFFTVDPWLMAAVAWALFAIVMLSQTAKLRYAMLAGLFCGVAVACKATGLLLAVPEAAAIVFVWSRRGMGAAFRCAVMGSLAALLIFRLLNPFAFTGPTVFDISLSPRFMQDLQAIANISSAADFPPNWQWLAGYPLTAFLRDFILFGSGPAMLVLALLVPFRRFELRLWLLPLLVAAPFIILTAASFAPALRYAAPALPALAVAFGLVAGSIPLVIPIILTLFAVWWGSGVYILHSSPNSRVRASLWLYTDVPAGTAVANETSWDDGLPIRLPGTMVEKLGVGSGGENTFKLLTLGMTDNDDDKKRERMISLLDQTELVIQSSGRQRDVLPRMPERFPMAVKFYQALADGSLCFEKVWDKGDTYPLPLAPFHDGFSQEPWRVYDHPRVIIYRKQACFDAGQLRQILSP